MTIMVASTAKNSHRKNWTFILHQILQESNIQRLLMSGRVESVALIEAIVCLYRSASDVKSESASGPRSSGAWAMRASSPWSSQLSEHGSQLSMTTLPGPQ